MLGIDIGSFVTRFQRDTAAAIAETVVTAAESGNTERAKVAQVEYHLTRGHELYNKRRYQEAVGEYLEAEGLMYSLAHPRFDPRAALGSDVVLPVEAGLFESLAEVVIGELRIRPDPPPEVVPSPSIVPPVSPELDVYDRIGRQPVLLSSLLDEDALTAVRASTEAVRDGNFADAVPLLETALAAVPVENTVLRAEMTHDLGLALAGTGHPEEAVVRVDEARTLFADAGHASAVSLTDETAVAFTREGGGGVVESEVAENLVRSGTVRGFATTERLREPVVGRVLGGAGDGLAATAAGIGAESRVLRLATGLDDAGVPRVVEIDLGVADAHLLLKSEVYEKRVNATTLDELGVGIGAGFLLPHFVANVPHHYYFTVQICLGDTYKQLGQFESAMARYERARGYQYLNPAIEAPLVWTRLGECLVDWGYDLYRSNKFEDARTQFRRVVEVAVDGTRSVPAESPLFGHVPFAAIEVAVPAYLADLAAGPPAPVTLDMAVLLRRAAVYQDMLHAGLNVLGLPINLVPVFRFRYLQAVARYFAEQAIKAEREYMSFMSNSEQETANQLQLRQAVDLADAAIKLEDRRVAEAAAERDVAMASRDLAQLRVDNAAERRAEYADVSADRVALDTATAHASGGFTETEGGYSVTLSTSGQTVNLGDEDYEIMRSAARHRGMIQRQFELDDMARTQAEYAANRVVADAQVALSDTRMAVAQENRAIAGLRRQQALALLDYAQSKTFGPALWHALADRMRDFAQLYLDRAIEIGYLMQAAYNFETDAGLDKISANYGTSWQLNGLLGGNALLADIDYFTYHYVTQTRSKELQVKTVLSLAEHFPFALFQFRRTGVANFETTPEMFDRFYPGSYLHRLKAVEVVVEGVVPADGIYGSFRNTGVSAFRTSDNGVKTRLQPLETMLLSTYTVRGDAVVFRPSDEMRGVFEDSGAATAWTLEIPPGSNDLRYQSVSDIKVVLYHTALHDRLLEQAVRAALPAVGNWSRTFSLRESRPDAFFLLLETGAAGFELTIGDFPYNQTVPQTKRLAVYAVSEGGAPAAGVTVDLSSGAVGPVSATTGADGTVTSGGGGGALDAFVDTSPLGAWSVSLDAVANPAMFVEDPPGSGVQRVRGLRDLVIAVDYEYTVRTSAFG